MAANGSRKPSVSSQITANIADSTTLVSGPAIAISSSVPGLDASRDILAAPPEDKQGYASHPDALSHCNEAVRHLVG